MIPTDDGSDGPSCGNELSSAKLGTASFPRGHMHVPFVDIKKINARNKEEFERAYARVVQSGWFIRGVETEQFEREFADWNGSRYCIGVANGLDALRLVLRAWITLGRLALGDEVVVPANSFIASALAVSETGLHVRLADVDPATRNVSASTVSAAITRRTRVVMPVHLYGRLAEVDAIGDLCRDKGLLMLEDAAQAHGATLRSKRGGTFGDAGAFSFYPAKNLGAMGDAGCVLTDDAQLADRVRALGNYGSVAKYEHEHQGVNSRIDELQSAILRIKLRTLDADNCVRRDVATRLCSEISNPWVHLPSMPEDPLSHVWHLFVVTTSYRASLSEHLRECGVETLIHYPKAIHRQKAYEGCFAETGTPNSERLQHEVLSLPISPVMTSEQVGHLIRSVNSWPPASA
jgi:dTDP-4-amino-4,6-dideoxygalactose transaminase